MIYCALCGYISDEDCKRDMLLDKIGDPPELISEILLKITNDTEHQFTSTEVCYKCTNKIERYYEAIQLAEEIKQEILLVIQNSSDVDCIYVSEEEEEEFIESLEHTEIVCPIEIEKEQYEVEQDIPDVIETICCEQENLETKNPKHKKKVAIEKFENEVKTASETVQISTAEKENEKSDTTTNSENVKEQFDCSKSKGISMYHASGIGQPIGIQCEICDRVFKYARTFHAHKKYNGFVGYICEICGIQCLTKAGMKDHARVHKPEKEFHCPQCDAQFHRKFLLKQHMAYHSNETPFQCEICAKCFVHRVALNVHKKIHTEYIRRFDCQLCEKKFRSVTHLRRHMAIHTGAKPFSCPICNNRFSQAYNMKAHMKLHTEPKARDKKTINQKGT